MSGPVVFVIDQLGGGGAERAFKTVCEALARRDSERVLLVSLEDNVAYALDPRLRVVTLVERLGPRTAPLAFARYLRLLKREGASLQISTNTKGQLVSLAAKRAMGVPVVPVVQVDLDAHYATRPWIRRALLRALRSADAVAFASRGLARRLERVARGRPSFVVPNPVALAEVQAAKAEPLPARWASAFTKPVLLSVGRLCAQKDQATLLKGFARSSWAGNLVILGEGPERRALEAQARALGLAERVVFAGFQANPFAYFAHAQAFSLTSAWEGFGNVLVEAMACGLPVISTDCPSGPRELLAPSAPERRTSFAPGEVEAAPNGLLVGVGDADALAAALDRVQGDAALCAELAAAGLRRADDFSDERVADAYAYMIERTLRAQKERT